jgi:excisionase family DNA binding protein
MIQIQKITKPAPNNDSSDNRLLSIDTVAALYEVSRSTVYRWINNDGLPTIRLPGNGTRGILRIAADELHRWREQFPHQVKQPSDPEKTLSLKGPRFLNNKKSESFSKKKLDQQNRPASRVHVKNTTEWR